jgi:hypothetical protein
MHTPKFLTFGLLAACLPLCADEGMWTFDNPPVKQLEKRIISRPRSNGWTTCASPACV